MNKYAVDTGQRQRKGCGNSSPRPQIRNFEICREEKKNTRAFDQGVENDMGLKIRCETKSTNE